MTVPAHIWSASSSGPELESCGSEAGGQGSVKSQRGLDSHVKLRSTVVQSPMSSTAIFVSDSNTLRMASWFNKIAEGSSDVDEVLDVVDVEEQEVDDDEAPAAASSKWEL